MTCLPWPEPTKLSCSANIWITDMTHFHEMNTVWDAWVSPGNAPARATVEAKLASARLQGRDHGGGGPLIPATASKTETRSSFTKSRGQACSQPSLHDDRRRGAECQRNREHDGA